MFREILPFASIQGLQMAFCFSQDMPGHLFRKQPGLMETQGNIRDYFVMSESMQKE